ncbi:MAG: mechanosensitive ion channel family protein [Phormidesmis sp.]
MGENITLSGAVETMQGWLQSAIALLPNIVIGIIVLIIFLILGKFIRSFIRSRTKDKETRNIGLVLGRLGQGVLVILGFLIAAIIIFPSFKPADLLASLGIGGVAIGFAFKDILQNFLAGILILLTEPFQIDDQIIFNDYEGTVERIETRATSIRTYDGRRVVIPNAELFTNSVMVNTAYDRRRLQYDIGIGYGDDIQKAKKIILDVLREHGEILENPNPEAIVVDLADSTINIRARWWVDPPRKADTIASYDWVLENICTRLVAAGIDLPFPTQQILLHDQTEETDGDRSRQREGWPVNPDKETPRALNLSRSMLTMVKAQRDSERDGTRNGNPENTRSND